MSEVIKYGPVVEVPDSFLRDAAGLAEIERLLRRRAQQHALRLAERLIYGWVPPWRDPNPMPRFRIWRWWP